MSAMSAMLTIKQSESDILIDKLITVLTKDNIDFWNSMLTIRNPEDYRFIKRHIPTPITIPITTPTGTTPTGTTTTEIISDEEKKDTYNDGKCPYTYTDEEKKMFFKYYML